MKKGLILTIIIIGVVFFFNCGDSEKSDTSGKPDNPTEYQNYIQAMKDIKTLMNGVESFITFSEDMQVPVAENIQELKSLLEPEHLNNCPDKDPWGNDYLFKRIDEKSYYLASAGSDGQFKGFDQVGEYFVSMGLEGQDIVLKNGSFVYNPK